MRLITLLGTLLAGMLAIARPINTTQPMIDMPANHTVTPRGNFLRTCGDFTGMETTGDGQLPASTEDCVKLTHAFLEALLDDYFVYVSNKGKETAAKGSCQSFIRGKICDNNGDCNYQWAAKVGNGDAVMILRSAIEGYGNSESSLPSGL